MQRETGENRSPDGADVDTGAGTVLVVDDDVAVQRVARRVLERAGYRVQVADDGASGVAFFRANTAGIICAVVDLSMPLMSGEETVGALRALRPSLPIVVASGYNEQRLSGALVDAPRTRFVQKPFSIEALVHAVAAVVRDPPERDEAPGIG